jgi:hypothetical protein
MAVVPVLAVTRQGGQSFVFVAQQQNGHFHRAPDVAVTLGDTVGNTYSISSGLNAGDKVIVSSTQFLVNGMPVMPLPGRLSPAERLRPCAARDVMAQFAPVAEKEKAHLVCRFLYSSAGLRHGLRAAHHSCRSGLHSHASHRHVSHADASAGLVTTQLCGRQRRHGREGRHHSAGRGHQRRRGHALHQFLQHQQRHQHHHGHFSDRLQSRHRRRRRAESRGQRTGPPARGRQCNRHHHHQGQLQLRLRRRLLHARRPLLARVHLQLPRRLREGRAQARPRRGRRDDLRRAQIRHARLARPAASWPHAASLQRRGERAGRAERRDSRRPAWASRRPTSKQAFQIPVRVVAASAAPPSSTTSSSRTSPTAWCC